MSWLQKLDTDKSVDQILVRVSQVLCGLVSVSKRTTHLIGHMTGSQSFFGRKLSVSFQSKTEFIDGDDLLQLCRD